MGLPSRINSGRAVLALAGVSLIAFGVWPQQALAQVRQITASDNVVRLRANRPPPPPQNGIRAGAFMLNPLLEVRETYDDNVYLRQDNIKSDYITQVKPALGVQSDWNRHSLYLGGQLTYGDYRHDTIKDYLDYGVLASGRYDLMQGDWINASANRTKYHSSRGAIDDPGGDRLLKYTQTAEQLDFHHGPGVIKLDLSGRNEHVELSSFAGIGSGASPTDVSSRDTQKFSAGIAYEYIPGNDIFLSSEYETTDFEPVFGGSIKSDGTNTRLGVHIDTNRSIKTTFYGGQIYRTSDGGSDVTKYYGGGRVLWDVTPLTKFQIAFDKSFFTLTVADAAGAIHTTRQASVTHSFTPRFSTTLTGGLDSNDYIGGVTTVKRDTDIVYGDLQADFKINDTVALRGVYDYRKRDSERASDEYTDNQVMVSVVLSY